MTICSGIRILSNNANPSRLDRRRITPWQMEDLLVLDHWRRAMPAHQRVNACPSVPLAKKKRVETMES